MLLKEGEKKNLKKTKRKNQTKNPQHKKEKKNQKKKKSQTSILMVIFTTEAVEWKLLLDPTGICVADLKAAF